MKKTFLFNKQTKFEFTNSCNQLQKTKLLDQWKKEETILQFLPITGQKI